MAEQVGVQKRSTAAIVGIVLGIIAFVLSWMPIINNFAFVLGGIGVIFAIVGLVGALRGTRSGKGLAVASVAVNVVALAIVLGMQGMYASAVDDAVNGPDAVSTEASGTDEAGSGAETPTDDEASYEDLAVGTSVTFEDGLSLTVDSVTPGLVNYDGSTVIGIQVTYTNNGSAELDYNSYSWKGRDAQGAATNPVLYYSDSSADDLSSGTLAPGGTVTGSIYFEGDSVSALYYANIFADGPAATWTIA